MKTNLLYVLALFCMLTPRLFAQTQTITVEANSEDISQNLDLKAVANAFGDSKDLEDFEKRLNDYDNQISNLDLNGDGEVDYLRVIETNKGNIHLIVIQAVLGQDIFQDVASLLVEKDETTQKTTVQVVGDTYIYGANYVLEPIYITVPVIYDYFWRPAYVRWYSPYYWGYYPTYYRPRPFVYVNVYTSHIHHYNGNHHGSYRYPSQPHHHHDMYNGVSRHDYETRHPENSYSNRQGKTSGTYGNARDLGPTRPGRQGSTNQAGSRQGTTEGGRMSSTPTKTDGRHGTATSERTNTTKPVGTRTNSGTKTTVKITSADTRTSKETNTKLTPSTSTPNTRVGKDNSTRSGSTVKPTSSSSSSKSGSTRTSSSSSRSGKATSTSSSSSSRKSGSSTSVRSGGSSSKKTGTKTSGSTNRSGSRSSSDRTGRR